MADGSADQSIVVELKAAFDDFISAVTAASDKLGTGFQEGAGQASDALDDVTTKAEEKVEEIGEAGERAGESFSQGLTLALAAGAAEFLDTMRETIEKASEYATQLGTLKLISGDDETKLQGFEFALNSVGLSSDRANMQLSLMQRRIETASQKANDTSSIFYRLGLSAKDMAGKDAISNFETLADKISNLRTGTERTDAAMELFGGRLGGQMLRALDQGKSGLDALMASASGMGAIIPPGVLKSLDDFDIAMKQLAKSTQAFFSTLAGPLIPILTQAADAVMRVYAAIEQLSSNTKLSILVGSLVVAFLQFQRGLEVVGGFMKGLISKELLEFLGDWAGGLRLILIVASTVFAAYQTNFAGVRDVSAEVIGAITYAFDNLGQVIQDAGNAFRTYVIPALEELSNALRPVVTLIASGLVSALDSIPWATVSEGVRELAQGLAQIISWIAQFITYLNNNQIAAYAFAAAIAAVVITMNGGVGAVIAFAGALITDAITAINATIVSLYGLVTAEAAATFGISLLVTAIIAGLVFALTHLNQVIGSAIEMWSQFVANCADVVRGAGVLLDALSDLTGGIIQNGDSARDAAGKLDEYAQSMDRAARAKYNQKSGPSSGYTGPDRKGESEGSWGPDTTAKPEKTPTGSLAPVVRKGGQNEAQQEALDRIKDKVTAAKDAFAAMEAQVKLADIAVSNLAKNAGPAQIAEAYNAKLRATNNELVAQAQLVGTLGQAEQSVNALRATTKDPKEERRLHDEARSYHSEELAAIGKEAELNASLNKIREEGLAKQEDFYKSQAGDVSRTFDQQVKSEEQILSLMKLQHDAAAAIAAQRQKIVDAASAELELQAQISSSQSQQTIDNIKTQDTIRSENLAAGDKSGGKTDANFDAQQAAKLAEAQDKVTIAALEAANAQDAVAAANDKAAQEAAMFGPSSSAALKAQADLQTAQTNLTSKTNALSISENELRLQQLQTSQRVKDVNAAFTNLIQSGLGSTLTQIIQGLQGSTLNLTQGFISLFEQSRSFYDIQQTFKEITSRLAQVFDALRPVIDILLGIFIGITDVLLELFNIVAEIIGLFGIHIQKIKLLNDSLTGLDQSTKPLLQITHDLPTMNQYNAGKMGDLEAQNNGENSMMQGFSQIGTGIGQIIGVLIGIKLLMGLMAGQSIGGQLSGPINMFKSMFGLSKPKDPSTEANTQANQQNTTATQTGTQGAQTLTSATQSSTTAMGTLTTALDNLAQQIKDGSGSSSGSGSSGGASSLGLGSSSDDDGLFDAYSQSNDDDSVGLGDSSDDSGLLSAFSDSSDSTKTQTTATNNLNNSMTSLTSMLPALTSMLGSKLGGAGGGLLGAVGAVGGIFSTMAKMKGGASTGAMDTGNYVAGGLELFGGLSKGGTFSQTLGGAGDIVGTIFGGPVGGAIGNALGTIIGGFFGPHLSAYKNPDIDDKQNYGQDVANIQGVAGASGTQFTESGALSSVFGGKTGESAIEEELSKGMAGFMKDTGLSASDYQTDLADFGSSATGAGKSVHGKNIGDISFSGVEGQEGTHRYDVLNSALEQFAQGLESASGNLANAFGTEGVDLASLYGNGQVVTTSGGYNVGGASATAGNPTSGVTSSVTITIAPGTGLSEGDATKALTPVLTEHASNLARVASQISRNSGNIQGRT